MWKMYNWILILTSHQKHSLHKPLYVKEFDNHGQLLSWLEGQVASSHLLSGIQLHHCNLRKCCKYDVLFLFENFTRLGGCFCFFLPIESCMGKLTEYVMMYAWIKHCIHKVRFFSRPNKPFEWDSMTLIPSHSNTQFSQYTSILTWSKSRSDWVRPNLLLIRSNRSESEASNCGIKQSEFDQVRPNKRHIKQLINSLCPD